ncbi:hypothetical protein [Kitasatospora sp. NPDC059327]|uniref:hypothetical protein n=1 Tax=Kitasatospora sp. NPDC059327 TaxID=3346803 RepID=UPI003681E475
MMSVLPDRLAEDLEDRDPLRRYRAADNAITAAVSFLEEIKAQALRDLAAGPAGMGGAAREIGDVSRQALTKWLDRRAAATPTRAEPAPQEQPALHFSSAETAGDALLDWRLAQEEVDDRRDVLVLGALAAGVDPITVYRTSGIPLEVIHRLRPDDIEVGVDLHAQFDLLEDCARALTAHAEDLAATTTTAPEQAAGRLWSCAAHSFTRNLAPLALVPPTPAAVAESRDRYQAALHAHVQALRERHPDVTDDQIDELVHDALPADVTALEKEYFAANQQFQDSVEDDETPPTHLAQLNGDAWLAQQITQLRRQAAAGQRSGGISDSPEVDAAMAEAYTRIADAYTHLRATGTVPALPPVKAAGR